MQVYTYCSYKGNYSGYQYAFFDTENKNGIRKVESVKSTESFPDDFKQIKSMMELKSGWKLILKKYVGDKGILFVSKVEEEADVEKRKILEQLEEEKIRNQFRGQQGEINKISFEKIETEFFINLAFIGNLEFLRKMTAHYILDIISNEATKREDNNSWLKRMENILEKSHDKDTYVLDVKEYREWLKEIQDWAKDYDNKIYDENKASELTKFKKFLRNFYTYPYVRLENADKTKGRKSRIRDIEEKVIKTLLSKTNFSQEYEVIMTNGGTLPEIDDANIVFDIEYLR